MRPIILFLLHFAFVGAILVYGYIMRIKCARAACRERGGLINILVYNQNKTMAMREANLFFTYVRREFPDSRSIVEDYSSADKLLESIQKAPADIYVLSAVGDKKKHHLKLAQAIRARYRNNGILFVVHDLDDLKNIINASIAPDYVFVNEVTEPEIEKFFSTQGEHKVQRRLLPFTMDGRKQIISIQTIISVQAADKKVSIQVFDRAYITALTIAELVSNRTS